MIGIFDSGYGGLSILKAVAEKLPQYSYVYFGDNARAPYGSRHAADIFQCTKEGVELLFSQGCQLVILACNTASATSLRRIQQELLPTQYPSRRVLGIVVPTIEQITGVPWQQENSTPKKSSPRDIHTVGILATVHTIKSKAYEHEIYKRNQSIRVIPQACAKLVSLVEKENTTNDELQQYIKQYLAELSIKANGQLDAVLLGCTHFELINKLIKKHLPPGVALYQQPAIVAESLSQYLKKHSYLTATLSVQNKRQFFTSGNPDTASNYASRFLAYPCDFKKHHHKNLLKKQA